MAGMVNSLAKLTSMEDLLWFHEDDPRDLPFTEGEDGSVRPAGWVDPEAREVPPWTMYLETDAGRFNHGGEKEDLIRIAREAGVPDENIVIYDRAVCGYKPLA
jgi:hypothetical protein